MKMPKKNRTRAMTTQISFHGALIQSYLTADCIPEKDRLSLSKKNGFPCEQEAVDH
jgi:hypothetical protein